MTYVISFDEPSSHHLDKSGQKTTSLIEDAMTFSSDDVALNYLERNQEQIERLGTGAVPSRLR